MHSAGEIQKLDEVQLEAMLINESGTGYASFWASLPKRWALEELRRRSYYLGRRQGLLGEADDEGSS